MNADTLNLASLSLTHVFYDPDDPVSYLCALLALVPQALCIIYVTLIYASRELEIILMFAGQMVCEGLNLALKRIIREERPIQLQGRGYGMPSSHSQYVGFFAAYLTLFLLLRHVPPPSRKVNTKPNGRREGWEANGGLDADAAPATFAQRLFLSGLACAGAALTVFSRVYLNYHTPKQVCVGAGVGVLFAAAWYIATKLAREWGLVDLVLASPPSQLLRVRDLVTTEDPAQAGWPVRDTPGTTVLSYTPDGRHLITAGTDSAIRIFRQGDRDEPRTLDDATDGHTALASTNDSFIVGAEDGTVWRYDLASGQMDKLLVRCPLPVRDLCVSRDQDWVAVASDELVVKIVNVQDMTLVKTLRDQNQGAKHVSFDPSGRYIAVSCLDGVVCIYSFVDPELKLVTRIDGVVQRLEPSSEITSQVSWHPDGRAFAAVEVTNDIAVVAVSDWTKKTTFAGGHTGKITAISWSPNGAFLASASADGSIILWDTATRTPLKRYLIPSVIRLIWHPTENILSFTTSDGELFTYDGFVPLEKRPLLNKALADAPLYPSTGTGLGPDPDVALPSRPAQQYTGRPAVPRDPNGRAGTPDSLDDILGPASDDEPIDDFIEDDDGAGYAEVRGKRRREDGDDLEVVQGKRRLGMFWEPRVHEPFQPGSTPWKGDRRYLCLNLVGFVWTVRHTEAPGTHHTVTVEFSDRERYRDFHFTDPYLYDKACLNEQGTLFSCQSAADHPAMLYYRPHETWTARADWRTELPPGEEITAIALSDSFIVVCTSLNYVRVFTLFGTPYTVYRQKSQSVTCAAWRDYVITIGNGPIGVGGAATLTYSIDNMKKDEVCQNEDTVAVPIGTGLQSVMFSDEGDPCIYDSSGVLLILQHWRTPGQARWVPVLDTKLLERLQTGRKTESYWPVAVVQNTFHCVILKGEDQQPYFPRPLVSEFAFRVPVTTTPGKRATANDPDEDPALTAARKAHDKLEESLVQMSLLASLAEDRASAAEAPRSQRGAQQRIDIEIDKVLLQLLAAECREGEERGMKALELVRMMRDRSGRMLEAARKVAARYDRTLLDEKIRDLQEQRLLGADGDDDEDMSDGGFDN
ncbi:hypothetical protein KEM52_001038 [Ascosphaera acerosa]|nr:hypothetical protein KEM52_001038 [Ascosphaera acerosa]